MCFVSDLNGSAGKNTISQVWELVRGRAVLPSASKETLSSMHYETARTAHLSITPSSSCLGLEFSYPCFCKYIVEASFTFVVPQTHEIAQYNNLWRYQ